MICCYKAINRNYPRGTHTIQSLKMEIIEDLIGSNWTMWGTSRKYWYVLSGPFCVTPLLVVLLKWMATALTSLKDCEFEACESSLYKHRYACCHTLELFDYNTLSLHVKYKGLWTILKLAHLRRRWHYIQLSMFRAIRWKRGTIVSCDEIV